MSENPLTPAHARLGVRLLALYFLADGLWQLLTNLFASLHAFDPNYLGFYVRSQTLGPLLGMAIGLSLYFLSGPIGRCLFGRSGA